jgi:acetyl/propionyl-CoA carboxylase alpha subunit
VADEGELLVEGQPMEPPPGWSLDWVDREQRVAVLHGGGEEGGEGGEGGGRRALVAVDGGPGEWVVTLRGRPIRVTVRSHRDRLLAEAATSAGHRSGAAEVRASLPGLVVRVAVSVGDAVGAGDPLVTIEAMKMQNEIRAPRAGRVAEVTVTPGQAIAGGALLVRLAEPDP